MDPTVILAFVGAFVDMLTQLAVAAYGTIFKTASPFEAVMTGIVIALTPLWAFAAGKAIQATRQRDETSSRAGIAQSFGASLDNAYLGTVFVDVSETTEHPFCSHCGALTLKRLARTSNEAAAEPGAMARAIHVANDRP